jgi:hypothetical protein
MVAECTESMHEIDAPHGTLGTSYHYQTRATLSSNIGALQHDKRSPKKPSLTKINVAHLLKWLAASCVLTCLGAAPVSDPAAPCYHTTGGCASSPHFVKPRHTVWHNGTEHESQVIVKLVHDRAVLDQPSNPGLPAPGLTAPQHVILSIGHLNLNAEPVFPTHRRRRKLQATGEPSDPLHLFFVLDAPDGNGAALCDQLNGDSSVEIAYLAPMPPELPIHTSSDGQLRTLQAIRHALASKTDLRRMLSPSFVHLQGYRGPAPNGFDFDVAEEYAAGLGAGITVADIEGGVNLDHEDLGMQGAEVINSISTDLKFREHGTAVWGEIKGEHDPQGVRGGAVAVTPIVASVFDANGKNYPNPNPNSPIPPQP